MALKKSEKAVAVDALHEKMNRATFAAAVHFNKLDADTAIELRKALRNSKVDYKVIKNTLARRAAKGTLIEKLAVHFKGPTAIALGYGDVVAVAKAITEAFKKSAEKVKITGAVAEGSALDAKGVESLSKMPNLNESRSMLLGMLMQPATRLVQMINAPASSLARVLQAHIDKSGKVEGEGEQAA
jgi:large subunit ribosomal protein L10